MKQSELVAHVIKVLENSYAPYSHFHVGAERTAIFHAVSCGKKNFL